MPTTATIPTSSARARKIPSATSVRRAGSPPIEYVTDTLRYNNAYGTCTTTCVQLITYPDYDNPDATLINMQRHPQQTSGNEKTRIATRTTVEDVVVSAATTP